MLILKTVFIKMAVTFSHFANLKLDDESNSNCVKGSGNSNILLGKI